MANPYLDQLELAIGEVKDLFADGKLTVGEIFAVTPQLVARAQVIMAEAQTFTEEDEAYILAAADVLYDKHITPLDVPWVPENIEDTVVDPLFKAGIRLALSRAMKRFRADGLVGSAL